MVFKAKKKPIKKKEEVEEESEEEDVDDFDEEEMEEQKTEKEIEVINKETEKLQDRIKKLKEGKTEEIQTWTVQEVSTQTTPVIYNSKTKKPYDLLSAIVELLNRTEE